MHDEFTPAVARALELAEAWARALAEPAVRPVHVFQALLQEEEGRAWALLSQAGLEPGRVRMVIPPPHKEAPHADESLPLDKVTQNVLALARTLARDYALEHAVASEHLLVALLREDHTLRDSLAAHGLALAQLESEILSSKVPPLALDEPLELDHATHTLDVARILDACANRAREAARVVEDYCRFVLDDALLSRTLKELRHELTDALKSLPGLVLLEARDTQGDVGTTISTEQEQERGSLIEVVQANWKRLEEALRSLEEYGKLYDTSPLSSAARQRGGGEGLGQKLEALRYRAYTLERSALLSNDARTRLENARLYVLLTASRCKHSLATTIREAAAGGAKIFQLREKDLADRELLERAREVRRLTREVGALFIMNDRPDLARLADADGVHLGQDELPVSAARRILGPDALIGVSTHNLDQVRHAVLDGAGYIGVGPTFPSATKEFDQFPGLEFVKRATAETSLPAFVVGGVTLANLDAAIAAGAKRVAVSDAICGADDPKAVALEMVGRICTPSMKAGTD